MQNSVRKGVIAGLGLFLAVTQASAAEVSVVSGVVKQGSGTVVSKGGTLGDVTSGKSVVALADSVVQISTSCGAKNVSLASGSSLPADFAVCAAGKAPFSLAAGQAAGAGAAAGQAPAAGAGGAAAGATGGVPAAAGGGAVGGMAAGAAGGIAGVGTAGIVAGVVGAAAVAGAIVGGASANGGGGNGPLPSGGAL